MDSNLTDSVLSSYFKDKSILITGATGYLGKILIEKLLRSCNDLRNIYVLVRMKKGKLPHERLDDLFKSNCLFDKVKEMYPNFKSKIIAVEGDLMHDNLGLSDQDQEIIKKNVNIIFHSAATVRFDEPLKVAVNINVIGTKRIIELSKSLKNLEVFVHVSTAYANCDKKYITEEVFKPPVMPDKIIEAFDWLNDDIIKLLNDKIIHPRPNTYTFTKAIAEYLVFQESNNLPIVIIRPSIVGACWHEPYPGWLDNYNGPTGLFAAHNSGMLRCMVGNREAAADIIPVDVVINMMIASAWFRGSRRTKKLFVFNCTSDRFNRCTWGMVQKFSNKTSVKYPSSNLFYLPYFRFTKYKFIKDLICFTEQIIPAYLADFFLKLQDKKPIFMKIQNKLKNAVNVLESFTQMHLEFSTDNYLMLMNEMSYQDKEIFKFDTRKLDWDEYTENYYLGMKKYLLREDMKKIEKYRKKYFKLKLIRNLVGLSILLLVIKIAHLRSKKFKSLFNIIFILIFNQFRRLFLVKFLLRLF